MRPQVPLEATRSGPSCFVLSRFAVFISKRITGERSSASFSRHWSAPRRSSAGGAPARRSRSVPAATYMIAAIRLVCSCPRTPCLPGRHLVKHRAESKDVRSARRLPCLRAAPAPCTGTCRGSCPPRQCGAWLSVRRADETLPRCRLLPRGRTSPDRSRAAWLPTSSASRCPASGPDARSLARCALSSASAICDADSFNT